MSRRPSIQPRRSTRRLNLELLEDRSLLDATPANVVAIFTGTLDPSASRDIPVVLRTTPNDFTLSGGTTVLGIQVRSGGGGFDPDVAVVTQGGNAVTPLFQNANLAGSSDSLAIVDLGATNYTVQVRGQGTSSGAYKVEVFLVGDADGNGIVNAADGTLIRNAFGVRSPDARYNAAYDSNRDGIIEAFDLAQQRRNLNDATQVRPLTTTVSLANNPVVLGDGRLLTNVPASAVVGTATSTGIVAALETGTDHNFDNGSANGDAVGAFSIPTTLAEGSNPFRLRVRDGFGQEVFLGKTASLDTVAPTFAGSASVPASASYIDLTYTEAMGPGAFVAANYALNVTGGPVAGGSGSVTSVESLADNTVRLHFAAPLEDGRSYEVAPTAAVGDLARNTLAAPALQPFAIAESFAVTEVNPADGAELVATTRGAIVYFSEVVDPNTITNASVKALATGEEVSGSLLVSSTGRFATFYPTDPWPASTEIRIEIDGGLVRTPAGDMLDADGDGLSGGTGVASFRTLPLTRIPNTNIFGYVYDSYHKDVNGNNIPVVGATIRVDSLPDAEVTTDANGYFLLTDMPAPEFFVHIDGTTAINAPTGTVYPSVGKPFHTVPGQTVQLNMAGTPFSVYLPPMAIGDIVDLSPTQTTQVGFGAAGMSELQTMFPGVDPAVWARMQVSFAPGAAIDRSGTAATQATVIPVPPDRLPAPLPANVDPQLVISIQALGATTFDVPAPVTFPNLEGQAPGEQALIWSFDHAAGHWVIIGTGTVSADGAVITSDPGVGIVAPGWHFVISGSPGLFRVGTSANNEYCAGPDFTTRSSGLFTTVDNAINGAINTVIDLVNYIPFVDIPNITVTPIESTLRTAIRGQVAVGTLLKGGSPGVTIPYYDWFMAGNGGAVDVTMPPGGLASLEAEVRADPAHMAAFDALKMRVTDLINQEIQSQADGGSVDLNQVKANVADRLAGSPDVRTITFNRTNTFVIIHGTQAAQVDIEMLHATGNIPVPGAGGTGTWTATIIYRLFDDFGFSFQEDVGDHFTSGVTHLNNALNKVEEAEREADAALDSLFSFPPHPIDAFNHAKAAVDALVAAAKEVKEAAEEFGIAGLFLQLYALQRFGSAVPFKLEIPIDDPIDGTFTIPSGYEDVIIQSTGGFGPQGAPSGTTSVSTVPGFGTRGDVYYRYVLQNGTEITGKAGDGQLINTLVLPPNQPFTASFYVPRINSSAVLSGRASRSGQPSFFLEDGFTGQKAGVLEMTTFGGIDHDADGIPDIGEFVLGTDRDIADSDGDGINDGAELDQGLDPLDGRAFPTGTISSLPLAGNAEDVAVDGNRVYVANGSGLAIIDATQFNNPILLGQLGLSGNATSVGVDGGLGIAVVTLGDGGGGGGEIGAADVGGLSFVDVSDGMRPRLIRTLTNVPATHVEVANGLAYAIAGNALRVVDLVTGTVVQSLELPGSGIDFASGFAREGTFLYAYLSGSGTFCVIDIGTEGEAVVRGQVNVDVASSDVGLFAANGVAWLSGSGLRTINISDPDNPTIIQTPQGDEFFTARRFALNGSGLGLLLPDGGNFLQVYRTSDPTQVADLLFELPLADSPRALAISRGVAYVGDGNRLEVVNYLPFDNRKINPVVALSTSAGDADLIQPGVQVLEGATLPLRVDVSDDVQVRNVELLLNGVVIGNDVSFPFDFFAAAPALVGGVTTFSLQVRATDTGGNSNLSNLLSFQLINDTTTPTITRVEPPTGASRVEPLQTVQVRFSKPMDAATLTAQAIRVRDSFGAYYTPVNFQLRDSDRLAQLTLAPLAMGSYEIVVSGGVADRAGNTLLASGDFISPFSLTLRGMVLTSVVDVDPGTAGVQVYEGTTVPLSVTVVSGVDVQAIELFVNGVSLGSDATAPYTFSVVAANIAPGVTGLAVQARVTDTGGVTTLTNVLGIGLVEDVTAPTIASTTPPDTGSGFENLTSVLVTFSEPLAVANVALSNFHLFMAGAGGLFDGSETEVPILGLTLENDDARVKLTTNPLPIGVFQLRVMKEGITDRALNAFGTGTFVSQFTLEEQLIVNGGFEDGTLDGWTLLPASGGAAQVVTNHLGFSAVEGTRFARLDPGSVNQFTRLRQTFTARVGDTISGRAYFNAEDYLPYNDTGYVRILLGTTIVATVFSASVSTIGDRNETPWTPWMFTFGTAGSYIVEAGIANITDSSLDSYLGLDAVTLTRGAPLMGVAVGSGAPTLTMEAAQAVVTAAEQIWERALGVDVPSIVVVVEDLPGAQIGAADFLTGRLRIDINAAGVGWFVDATPFADEEFVAGLAFLDAPASGRYDLLTTALHEIGHILGFDHVGTHDHSSDVMNESLSVGERRLPAHREALLTALGGALAGVETRMVDGGLGERLVQLAIAMPGGTLRPTDLALTGPRREESVVVPLPASVGLGDDNAMPSIHPIVERSAKGAEEKDALDAFFAATPWDELEI